MKYAAAFFFFSIALTYLAFLHGGFALALLWPAISFFLVAMGYATLGSGVMGKNEQGQIAWWSRVLLLPFHLFVITTWWIGKMISREPIYHEITPVMRIGRRCGEKELPPGIELIVDLTSEFADPRSIRNSRPYLCVSTLDGFVPDQDDARAAIRKIASCTGPVYIHCAQGHGRSGTLAAAVLVDCGLAHDVEEAIQMIKALRPGVRLNRRQRDFVRKITQPS